MYIYSNCISLRVSSQPCSYFSVFAMEYFNISINLEEIPKSDHLEEEQEEDALSLCNLSLQNDLVEQHNDTVSLFPEDDFKFSTSDSDNETILFFGKSIRFQKPNSSITKTKSFSWRSEYFKKLPSSHSRGTATRSSSVRFTETGKYRCQSSSSGRKHWVLFGLSKLPARMELSDIRKRQSRRTPVSMFGVGNGSGDKPVVSGGESGGKGNWGLLRPLRLRSNLVSALARVSFGCIRHI